jgi:hypothetical protein
LPGSRRNNQGVFGKITNLKKSKSKCSKPKTQFQYPKTKIIVKFE